MIWLSIRLLIATHKLEFLTNFYDFHMFFLLKCVKYVKCLQSYNTIYCIHIFLNFYIIKIYVEFTHELSSRKRFFFYGD